MNKRRNPQDKVRVEIEFANIGITSSLKILTVQPNPKNIKTSIS